MEGAVPIHNLKLMLGLWAFPSCLYPPAAATELLPAGTGVGWAGGGSRNEATGEETANN